MPDAVWHDKDTTLILFRKRCAIFLFHQSGLPVSGSRKSALSNVSNVLPSAFVADTLLPALTPEGFEDIGQEAHYSNIRDCHNPSPRAIAALKEAKAAFAETHTDISLQRVDFIDNEADYDDDSEWAADYVQIGIETPLGNIIYVEKIADRAQQS